MHQPLIDPTQSQDHATTRLVPAGALDLLILQPTPFCNINCDYCYLPDRDSTARMSMETLGATMQRVFESGISPEQFTVVWHAGEPLVLGVDWYREALDVIDRATPAGTQIAHSIQTNGMLIDDAWCDFVLEHGDRVRIGISVDGPAPLHDSRRKTRSGKGTLAQTLRGIAKLNQREIGFHVITVLTRAALEYPDELFEFYRENDITQVGFNVEEIEGGHRSSSLVSLDVEQKYRAFMRRFLALMDREGGMPFVRDFDSMFKMLGASRADLRDHQNSAWSIVSVDVNGNFSTFSPELIGVHSEAYGDFTIGNVTRDSFEQAARSERFRALDQSIAEGVEACKTSCRYYGYCGGGAPANKFFENGTMASTETMFCRLTKKALADVCADFLVNHAPQDSVVT